MYLFQKFTIFENIECGNITFTGNNSSYYNLNSLSVLRKYV